jgi:anti-sigma factor RsiW
MKRRTEKDLIRRLHGELPAEQARELDARLDREPELARRYGELRERWEGLVPPPPAPVPLGFTGRVMAHIETAKRAEPAEPEGALSWSLAPTWVRAAAAAALVFGMALGASLGLLPQRGANDLLPGTASMGERVPLADSYGSVLEETFEAQP